jgi:hypothetical protein
MPARSDSGNSRGIYTLINAPERDGEIAAISLRQLQSAAIASTRAGSTHLMLEFQSEECRSGKVPHAGQAVPPCQRSPAGCGQKMRRGTPGKRTQRPGLRIFPRCAAVAGTPVGLVDF